MSGYLWIEACRPRATGVALEAKPSVETVRSRWAWLGFPVDGLCFYPQPRFRSSNPQRFPKPSRRFINSPPYTEPAVSDLSVTEIKGFALWITARLEATMAAV